MTQIYLPDSVIGISSFQRGFGWSGLKEISIGNKTHVSVSAFAGDNNLTIHFRGTIDEWKKMAYYELFIEILILKIVRLFVQMEKLSGMNCLLSI